MSRVARAWIHVHRDSPFQSVVDFHFKTRNCLFQRYFLSRTRRVCMSSGSSVPCSMKWLCHPLGHRFFVEASWCVVGKNSVYSTKGNEGKRSYSSLHCYSVFKCITYMFTISSIHIVRGNFYEARDLFLEIEKTRQLETSKKCLI